MNGEYIFDISSSAHRSHDLESYEYHTFYPSQNSDLNNFSDIRIVINNKDPYFHFHNAYIEIKGKLVKKTGGTAFAKTDKIAFTNNPIPFMFRNFTYKINGSIVESVDYPGHVCTMLAQCLNNGGKRYTSGLIYCWYADTSTEADGTKNKGWEIRRKLVLEEAEPIGSFTFQIPLTMIFGFAEFKKVISGVTHEFQMTRQEDFYALFQKDAGEGKITLDHLRIWVPVAKPAGQTQINLKENQLTRKKSYAIDFYKRRGLMVVLPTAVTEWVWNLDISGFQERARYLILGFQLARTTDQKSNYAIFDNSDVKRMSCYVNDVCMPYVRAESNFKSNDFGNFYRQLQDFSSNYLQIDPILRESGINPMDFKKLFPYFCFDLTKRKREIEGDVANACVKVSFGTATSANLRCYACLLSEKQLLIEADGSDMVIR